MPFIKLLYGPYESHGIIRHKTQRLHGLIERLTKLDFEIEIVPSIHINRLTIEMLGREVFRCNIRHLMFNIECDNDPVCQKAVAAVQEAATRLYSDRNIPSFYQLSKGKRILQTIKNAQTTQDLFSTDVQLWFEIRKNSAADLCETMSSEATVLSDKLPLQ